MYVIILKLSHLNIIITFYKILFSNFILFYFSFCSDEKNDQKTDDAFREVIVSCRSLSNYETTSIKSAFPQVRYFLLIFTNIWFKYRKIKTKKLFYIIGFCCNCSSFISFSYRNIIGIFCNFNTTN